MTTLKELRRVKALRTFYLSVKVAGGKDEFKNVNAPHTPLQNERFSPLGHMNEILSSSRVF